MKKIILFVNVTLLSVVCIAQTNPCEIEESYQDSTYNLWPDTVQNLPIAQVDTYYETHVQIKTPAEVGEVTGYPYMVDIGLPIEFDVSEVEIDSIQLVETIGLPEGMSLYYSAQNATYLGDDVGCVALYGNTTSEMIGTHDIVFVINGWVTVAGGVVALSEVGDLEEITGYKFVVTDDGTASIVSSEISSFQLNQNIPNPFSSTTEITFESNKNEKVNFVVVDLLGKTLIHTTIEANYGTNRINFNSSELTSGLYFYSISNGIDTQTKRMLVAKK